MKHRCRTSTAFVAALIGLAGTLCAQTKSAPPAKQVAASKSLQQRVVSPATGPPAGLPCYDLDIHLDTNARQVAVKQLVTWTNRSPRSVQEIVFNAHARFTIADDQIGFLAKMLELLRMTPREAFDFNGPPLEVASVTIKPSETKATPANATPANANAKPLLRVPPSGVERDSKGLPFAYAPDNPTALVVSLPNPVQPGESVTLELNFTVRLLPKKGRWGQWDGVTTLAQWLPVVAVLDNDKGWQPTPYIPWHQPFHNEAGHYNVRVTLPADQLLAHSGIAKEVIDLGDGWKQHVIAPVCVRDFALIASARFQEHIGQAGDTRIRVLALPEHEWYAKDIVKVVEEALPVYNRWFGAYPYPQFTVAEAYFGWNGNECGSLVMIDSRMMGMPHMARAYVDYLVSHELCHQWWYNVVGTNGYAETWMDEGLATYFSHRLINEKLGKDNKLLEYPRGLEWLPNITRDDFRNYGYLGVRARGETEHATVQEMPKFKHFVNLSAYTYDRGSKIVGMIEERLGPDAMLDFMRRIYSKYQFRILRVADFQRELEEYTGRSWEDFFQQWVYSGRMCDWSIDKVEQTDHSGRAPLLVGRNRSCNARYVVHLRQQGCFNEPTVLGIRLCGDNGYQLRVPINPDVPLMTFEDMGVRIECVPDGDKQCRVRVEFESRGNPPAQISVDPDRMLLDEKPTNNHWKPEVRWRFTPLYTALDEAEVANSFHCWNVICGPWVYGSTYNDPWYTRSPMLGLRAGAVRSQEFSGGAFLGYRSNDRNILVGADAVWDHCPLPSTQVGLSVEQALTTVGSSDVECSRGVVYGRHVIMPGSSLYLPPAEYVEVFGVVQNRCLPLPRVIRPGTDLFEDRAGIGIHYHKNFLTPYWDPEGGIALDASYQYGLPVFRNEDFHQVYGQFTTVKRMPKMDWLGDGPVLDWLRATRWAFRVAGAAALPERGVFFSMGGGDLFRGMDLEERQGNMFWLASFEWRIPIVQDVCWDFCDHVGSVKNVYLAPFYDVGNTYVNGDALGHVAHALGLGLRVDVAWLGLIERTMLRLDVAQPLGHNMPPQFWLGIQHPF